MPTQHNLIPRKRNHLRTLIEQEILTNGPGCDLNHIDVSKMQDFTGLFKGTEFCGDISRWNMTNAHNLTQMFYSSPFNGDISQWSVANVSDMTQLFERSKFNGDISNWNTQALEHAAYMFHASPFTGDVSRWNMSNVANTMGMFQNCPFNGDLSAWNLPNLYNCRAMFAYSPFNGDISRWDVTQPSQYCNFSEMFQENTAFSGDLSHWRVPADACTGMFSLGYKGRLPLQNTSNESAFSFYSQMFDQEDAFEIYLQTTPFDKPHADVLCTAAIRPSWFSKDDYQWFKDATNMANSIGMDMETLTLHILDQYKKRHGFSTPSESWEMGDALIMH